MTAKIEVLLVDDEEIVGKRLRSALEKHGYSVEVFANGESAVARLQEKQFDIVVSDIRMDQLDGLDVLDAVQRHAARTKTILMTGYATMEVAREALLKGAFDFIAKPFRPSELLKLIDKAVREQGASRPSRSEPRDP
jgi:DNA-binding NtrC family response regulator